ncbi:hypothetical protein P2H57_18465 [Citrobacter freundii]|uniref:Uncharacterized protein n=1 Tax=Citrobacter murliniae TaxID=67829 RepID=A0ABY2PUY3_9ENTR|nr:MULTISPECIES: hypothetical protein [Citrobacter]MCQ7061572.1 hypothetical protein [Escherichia coli]KLV62419.1 hypothetical protein SK36_04370 [Citrobacter sp. MGH106]MBJ9600040.1 hypothetical protein [Citrobacter werkmanii]MBJ9872599.1 hypothetical protein [Citrobacter werkmanii]MDK2361164.1 hypothetical protein [Citrobacter freundii]
MGIVAAGLREWNYQKINRLTHAGFSDGTIASAINDDLNERNVELPSPLTAVDVESYKKLSFLAGERSLISEHKIRALTDECEPDAMEC